MGTLKTEIHKKGQPQGVAPTGITMNIGGDTIPKNWLCYYGNAINPRIYNTFDLIVFDGYYHPPLDFRTGTSPRILGYLSVGEIDGKGPYWDLVKDMPFLIKENSRWGSWIVDVRDHAWQELLFETFIPSILDHGFDGLFLDTFDSALTVQNFEGMDRALIDITKRIKATFPDTCIALNRGLTILPYLAHTIDYVVVEGLYSVYAGHDEGYIPVDNYAQNLLLTQIDEGLLENPGLPVLTLDYASQEQTKLIKGAVSFSKIRGFIPYVGTYKLDEVFFY